MSVAAYAIPPLLAAGAVLAVMFRMVRKQGGR
jgi:hypothetical protein